MAIDYEAFRPHPTLYKGILFRSRLEARWAAFFDQIKWQWEYEPFDLGRWSPDFLIKGNSRDVLVEVKPITGFDMDVATKMHEADKQHHLLMCGLSPIVENEILATLYSYCRCDGHPSYQGWLARQIVGLNDRFDMVFGHWPSYTGFVTGVDIHIDTDSPIACDNFMGREVSDCWARATNAVQWRGPRKS